jgi:hypothetical protein
MRRGAWPNLIRMKDVDTKPTAGHGALAGYRSMPGVHDELLAADGSLRPAWSALMPRLAVMGPHELGRCRDGALRRGRFEPIAAGGRMAQHLVTIGEGTEDAKVVLRQRQRRTLP